MAAVIGIAGVIATAVVGFVAPPLYQRATTLGLLRKHFDAIHGSELKTISGTVACEDLHYDQTSGQLYTACQVSTL